ncbi:MAG: hypothetical protein QOF05_174 [Sphingomonadales bacterium]|nr:hypothetical protein [Sphingomonadales bacterium]
MTAGVATGGRRGRKLLVAAAALLLAVAISWFTLTSAAPSTPAPPAPSADAVVAGRDAYRQLRNAQGNRGGVPVTLGVAQLAGLSAVASHGFRPDRLAIAIEGRQVVVRASHHLRFGRWLNITMRSEGPSRGFPRAHLKLGLWTLPAWLSRWALDAGRLVLSLRAEVPPLDVMVRNFRVERGSVSALISLPGKSGLVDQMASAVAEPVDRASVLRIYCALSRLQQKKPSGDFAEQVRRAFGLDPEGVNRADFNRAAFVALGMFAVDERVGDFAQLSPADLGRCRTAVEPTAIYGRQDWPKHWALSAAIAVGAGTQLSEAAGEWKELADSLARQSQFAIGDPAGFSMADLAANRAGFRTARAAWQADHADRIGAALAHATAEQLLPAELIRREDAFSNAAFVKRYGGLDDPRFKQRVREIDAVLDARGLH